MKTTFTVVESRNLILHLLFSKIVRLSHLVSVSDKKNPSFFDNDDNRFAFDLIRVFVKKAAGYELSEDDTLFREAFEMFLRDRKRTKWYKRHGKEIIRKQAINDMARIEGIPNESPVIIITGDSRTMYF